MDTLTEKYRPREFSEVIGLGQELQDYINDKKENCGNIFLYGFCGTGKSTVARIIINMLKADALVINASKEKGIDTIRDVIYDFARTKSIKNRPKVVFLDECDYLTPQAQPALRVVMEENYKNIFFILACNFPEKIIEPLKSRCKQFRFDNPPKDKILVRLKYIAITEGIEVTNEQLVELIDKYYPDMRRMINLLERFKYNKNFMQESKDLSDEIISRIKAKQDFKELRAFVLDKNPNYDELFASMAQTLRTNKALYPEIRDTNRFINSVAIKDIEFEGFLWNLYNLGV